MSKNSRPSIIKKKAFADEIAYDSDALKTDQEFQGSSSESDGQEMKKQQPEEVRSKLMKSFGVCLTAKFNKQIEQEKMKKSPNHSKFGQIVNKIYQARDKTKDLPIEHLKQNFEAIIKNIE